MEYFFENLGPEKFQKFCQSLLTTEFPDVQCFPVAQPDGGRDAIMYLSDPAKGFYVFQVKYVRKPLAEVDPHKRLLDMAEQELPKIQSLIPKGAKKFYLITNVPGTAHPAVGSIDLMNEILANKMGIPSICWWRDDISQRLDKCGNLKWVYPEIITGLDMLRLTLESGLSESREVRTAVIKAFIKDQYDLDQEVRFKQVELQNKLLDLFIDVPVTLGDFYDGRKQRNFYKLLQFSEEVYHFEEEVDFHVPSVTIDDFDGTERYFYSREQYFYSRKGVIGAATILLHPNIDKYIPQLVLEGAPGQGKSTIAQYVCQIHRMRLLDIKEDVQRIPEKHRFSPLRLPFKIDLRDLATWLNKKDPFSKDESDANPLYWQKSLESFLVAQIRYHSGGANFTYEDLVAVLKASFSLLVFDGLDEVADISKRQEVVQEIVKGVNRIKTYTSQVQVLVTSRPAAFANSPGLPEDSFPHYQLDSLSKPLIMEYTDQWLKVRKVRERESSDIKNILKDKLDQPHLRDLARNPMQLAIFLSLIHTRGSSLPDKRTAFYDSYIEVFFNREVEKDSMVREHRDLLIDIHGYLAWLIHSETEQGQTSGRISGDQLAHVLYKYLSNEGHDPSLASTLFKGMVERVVALVSRVEGTYEFEVQPLREYFAARYLYQTARYSPTGKEQKGTKPDRFDAIARNFYWLNVTRFYAGRFDKGELGSLIDRLQELMEAPGYKYISYPRTLAATLLSDWVFSQHPKFMKEVINLILDGLGLRYVLTSKFRRIGTSTPLVLPDKCGREDLIATCFSILEKHPPLDYALDVINLIQTNSYFEEIKIKWLEYSTKTNVNKLKWLEYGLHLGLLSTIDQDTVKNHFSEISDNPQYFHILFKANNMGYCEKDEATCRQVIDFILDRKITTKSSRRYQSILELFSQCVDPHRYSLSFEHRPQIPLANLWSEYRGLNIVNVNKNLIKEIPDYAFLKDCLEIVDVANEESSKLASVWASELTPWSNIVEVSRKKFGEQWVHFYFANVSAGIKSSQETCTEFTDLLDTSQPLCHRTRYARLRAGNLNWWKNQLTNVNTDLDKMFIILILLTWGSESVLSNLAETIDRYLNEFSTEKWEKLIETVLQSVELLRTKRETLDFTMNALPVDLSARTATAFMLRATKLSSKQIYNKYLKEYKDSDPIVLEFCQSAALDLDNIKTSHWNPNLELISKTYLQGITKIQYNLNNIFRESAIKYFPSSVAEHVTKNSDKYPSYLVSIAETKYREELGQTIIAVGKIAEQDKWFDY